MIFQMLEENLLNDDDKMRVRRWGWKIRMRVTLIKYKKQKNLINGIINQSHLHSCHGTSLLFSLLGLISLIHTLGHHPHPHILTPRFHPHWQIDSFFAYLFFSSFLARWPNDKLAVIVIDMIYLLKVDTQLNYHPL